MQIILIEKVLWAIVAIYWCVAAFFVKRTTKRESVTGRSLYILCFLVAFELLFENFPLWKPLYFPVFPQTIIWKLSGLLICMVGLLLSVTARIYLGRNWSGTITMKKDHEFITSGPYRITRHPIYTGFLTAFAGCVITSGQLKDFIGLVLIWIALSIKISKEEKFLYQLFGDRFLDYKRKTMKLIPFIY